MYEVKINASDAQKMYKRLGHNAAYLEPFFKKTYPVLVTSIAEQFEKEGYPDPWRGLSKMTINMRRKGKGSGGIKILNDRGNLRMAWTGGHGHIKRVRSTSMHVGAMLLDSDGTDIAAKHQHGGRSFRGHVVPQRQVLFTPDYINRASKQLIQHVVSR